MTQFGGIFGGRRILVTGHTGFKGSWLVLWLIGLGAEVTGVSLTPQTDISHWELLKLSIKDHRIDIRDFAALRSVVNDCQPEIVFHLAAQPLVRRSYLDPLETWSTNVMGTANLLEVCKETLSVRAIVVVTTDKCYENLEWAWGYRENDRLGGNDPYSASKAGAELLVASYRSSFFNSKGATLLASARSGNVIGGGDWAEDRLIPDLIRAIEKNQPMEIRFPNATRPWQHVLDSLSGYLVLGQKLLMCDSTFADAWNFGPESDSNISVVEVLEKLKRKWSSLRWSINEKSLHHESNLLYLDCAKARGALGWKPVWNLDTTLEKTAEWYRAWLLNNEVISRQQLASYLEAANRAECKWALF